MTNDYKQKIALFRFQVIAPLLSISKDNRGEKEKILNEITAKEWEIPESGRSYIGRSTVIDWLNIYLKSEKKLESLFPKDRGDIGRTRAVDAETELALINLKKQYQNASIPSIIKMAQEQKIIPDNLFVSHTTLYRIYKRNDLINQESSIQKKDRRRFETELPNDLWQSDCLHGPMVIVNGKLKKAFLFAFIDDHSRLIPHGKFYLSENLESFMDCLLTAVLKRGLPRKLYVDNGPYFRSHKLQYTSAALGVALIYAKPYQPEGKGKIERWFRTVRMQFLSTINDGLTLDALNTKFDDYVNNTYHLCAHSSTSETPLARYTRHVTLLRNAPKNVRDYFRNKARRKVENDRTVSLNNRLFEAPINLIGKYVDLFYHDNDPECVEIYFNDASNGFLTILNKNVNSRVKREINGNYEKKEEDVSIKSGNLFKVRKQL